MKRILILSLAFILSACAVQKKMIPMGESKNDGTIVIGYQISAFEKVTIDENEARNQASKKCAAWGYEGAKPLSGVIINCSIYSGSNSCSLMQASVKYQCLGDKLSGK